MGKKRFPTTRAVAARTTGRTAGACAALAAALSLAAASPVLAANPASADETASPWSYCERAAIAIETTQKLPRALLYSVSTAESGRFDATTGKARPWPWTINAEGQSFYFASKREAIAATRRLLDAGVRSIDVGCMQINLHYHPDAFDNLADAFDPVTNATYAASFLKSLHAQTASWPKAVARYHSEVPERNRPYFARVIRIWSNEREHVIALTRDLKREAMAEVAKSLRGPAGPAEIGPALDFAANGTAPIEPASNVEPASNEAARPAPMVLGTADTRDVREGAVAAVGLRLSISEETEVSARARPAPRVIDAPTILADATGAPSL